MHFKKVTEKKPPKLAAWFDSTVELQLIHNCLYLAHLQSKLSSAPRLSPLGISFPSLLDPPERRYICRSPYSLSHLKTKNSLQRPSWARCQMLSLTDYSIFTDFSLKLRADYSLFAWCCSCTSLCCSGSWVLAEMRCWVDHRSVQAQQLVFLKYLVQLRLLQLQDTDNVGS